jgi:FkbM family methyltransferase
MRRWPLYNAPLVEVTRQASAGLGRPVDVIDVGAAVGDTALLLLDRCETDLRHIACVEGDQEFLGYLHANLDGDRRVSIHATLLSDDGTDIPALLRTHAGTASAQGADTQATTTLDDIVRGGNLQVDVLKVDTDGFDGRVLAGAKATLAAQRPAVVFEWHPRLYAATGNDWQLPFDVLDAAGYWTLVWFTKYGDFDHVQRGPAPAQLATLAGVCLSDAGPAPDWHYDVVALPENSHIDAATLSRLEHARRMRRHR